MLTIKQITENTEEVIRGLEKKHFKDAKATIEQVLAFNDKRRSTQNQLDKNLAEVNSLSKSIGQLMKEGKKEDAETAKAALKDAIVEINKAGSKGVYHKNTCSRKISRLTKAVNGIA